MDWTVVQCARWPLWTEICTRFWTDAQGNDDHFQETADRSTVLHMLQLQARLVTSSLVRTFPGPSGHEVNFKS